MMFRQLLLLFLFLTLSACGGGGGSGTPNTTDNNTNSTKYTLDIDKFGQGLITDNQSQINCGDTCSGVFNENQTITLTATPDPEWKLDHWEGCDSENGNTCVVAMTEDKAVYPTFSTKEAQLKSEVKLLDSATMALLKDKTDNTLVFDESATMISSLQPGDLIVSQTEEGFAKRVISVTTQPGLATILEVNDADLGEILTEGTIILHQDLSSSELESAKPLLTGAKLSINQSETISSKSLAAPKAGDTVFTINFPKIGEKEDNLSGSVSFTLTPDIAISANSLSDINEVRIALRNSAKLEASILSTSKALKVNNLLPIYNLNFAPMWVGPVLVVHNVTIYLFFDADLNAKVGVSYTLINKNYAGLQYLKSTGLKTLYSNIPEFEKPSVNIEGNIETKAGVKTDYAVKILGIAGPFVGVSNHIGAVAKAEAKTDGDNTDCKVSYKIFQGIDVEAGAKYEVPYMPFFSKGRAGREGITLGGTKYIIDEGSIASCSDEEAPSIPLNVSAKAVSFSEIDINWDKSSDNRIVSGYILNRDGKNLTSLTNNFYKNTNLKPSTTYCYSVLAFDSAKKPNKSEPSQTVCATTKPKDNGPPTTPLNVSANAVSTNAVQVNWPASSDDIGVTGYKVYRNNIFINSTQDLTFTDTNLKVGTQYCYTVQAYDEVGNKSELSVPVCTSTKSAGNGAWDMYMACAGNSYNIKNNLDLNESSVSNIRLTGSAADYDGTPISYILSGTYDSSPAVLSGSVTMIFTGNSCVRVDAFSAPIGTGDSGDVPMTQVQACGCDAIIRFVRHTASKASAKDTLPPLESNQGIGRLFNEKH